MIQYRYIFLLNSFQLWPLGTLSSDHLYLFLIVNKRCSPAPWLSFPLVEIRHCDPRHRDRKPALSYPLHGLCKTFSL